MNLQEFANSVTANVYQTSVDKLNEKNFGIDWVNLTQFVQVIAQIVTSMISNCPNKATIAASAKNPTWRQQVYLRWLVKDNCDCCNNSNAKRNSGKIAAALLNEAAKLTDEQIQKVIDDVEEPNNLLI